MAGRGIGVVALGLAVVAASCGTSGYQYVTNRDSGTYFKVPDDWELFHVSSEEVEGRPEALAPTRPWQVVFDADPNPSEDHLGAESPDFPVGFAQVVEMGSESERSQISLGSLRSMVLGGQADPLAVIQQGSDAVEIVDYEDVVDDDGHHGNRIVVNLKREDGTFVTVAQIAMVDPGTTKVYRLVVTCSSECFEQHRTEIDRVMDSWTIDPQD